MAKAECPAFVGLCVAPARLFFNLPRLLLALLLLAGLPGVEQGWPAGAKLLEVQVGVRVEAAYPGESNLSLIVFLALVGLVILIAGPLSLRITPDDPPEHPPVH